jgi:hypothetical protein
MDRGPLIGMCHTSLSSDVTCTCLADWSANFKTGTLRMSGSPLSICNSRFSVCNLFHGQHRSTIRDCVYLQNIGTAWILRPVGPVESEIWCVHIILARNVWDVAKDFETPEGPAGPELFLPIECTAMCSCWRRGPSFERTSARPH